MFATISFSSGNASGGWSTPPLCGVVISRQAVGVVGGCATRSRALIFGRNRSYRGRQTVSCCWLSRRWGCLCLQSQMPVEFVAAEILGARAAEILDALVAKILNSLVAKILNALESFSSAPSLHHEWIRDVVIRGLRTQADQNIMYFPPGARSYLLSLHISSSPSLKAPRRAANTS
ncbi:hypothetical protein NEOLEDRAFT_970499 [Neolentinus lepideus HHB14362 ss-1]|uniref:Uncharacterized protein n=1 Tax=Neolentinus lepideus HHB14362 ss-1 TaxID=1314782 RepID=A0A165NBV8_9AGAM|nr:hypothetical protein NEOLEDRAFT_970499 [Neolentinus lepideus HHB14362 ss-1]